MGKVSAQQAGVAVDACGASPATIQAGIEGDADNSVTKSYVDPFPLFIEHQLPCTPLMVLVEVGVRAEITFEGGRWLVWVKG